MSQHMPTNDRPRKFLKWAVKVFGPSALDREERVARFVEEAIELAHAEEMPVELLVRIVQRVYSRPPGQTPQELGQAQACLETLAESIGLSADIEAQKEWDRCQNTPIEAFRERHAVKIGLGISKG